MPSCVKTADILIEFNATADVDMTTRDLAAHVADLRNKLNRIRDRKVLADLELLNIAQRIVDVTKQA